ncbi:MAG: ATP-binding protein, partial [Cyanobium sp. MAG_160]|nr:ATP-binding protein [Cyanobium sp. MAG_160]
GLTSTGTGSTTKRVRLDQLPDPLVQATNRRLQELGGLAAPSSLASTQTVQYRGNTYLVGLHSWGQAEKLDWLLITALRSDQIVQASQRHALIALLLSLGAVATAVVVTIRVSDWLLAPLELLRRRCQSASEQVGQGDANLVFEAGLPKGSAREIEAVSQAFGALTERLTQARRQLAEAIERERLKDAQTVLVLEDKLKSSLQAAAVAHEINLPLSTLLLNSKLLLEQQEAPLPTNLNEHLQAIASDADEVVTTIEKMRSLLRNVQTHHRRLNLANVARSALLYAGPSLKAAGITVQREGLEASLAVLGDAAQIQIAVVNLLRNALETLETAGPAAATPATIAVRLQSEGDAIVLSVADNGPGFQAPQTALTPLETSKASGSGLGLFVVQTTMENHRGSLAIGRSSLGGAEVRLIFPAAPALPIT